jgi:hypothetical protein
MTSGNDQDRFNYDVMRAMADPEYRIEIALRDAELAIARLRAEYEAMEGRLNKSATRPPIGNAEHCPF